jgi:hypothetical protein
MTTLRCLVGVGLVVVLAAGCSKTTAKSEEKTLREGFQNTKPDLNTMRPQDRAMIEKFMQRPPGGPPPPPKK